MSQLSNRKVRHRARVLTGAAVLCPRPLDGGVSHCVPAFIACLLISFTRPRPQYRARPLPSGARLIRIANRHHQHHPPLPAPVSVWRACADLIRPCPRIPSTAISAPHNAPRNAIPLRARHTVTSPRYPSGLEAAADHQRDGGVTVMSPYTSYKRSPLPPPPPASTRDHQNNCHRKRNSGTPPSRPHFSPLSVLLQSL